MEYLSVNSFDTFYWHDALIESVQLENGNIVCQVRDLNITEENTENKFPYDMCIKQAEVIFEKATIVELMLWGHIETLPDKTTKHILNRELPIAEVRGYIKNLMDKNPVGYVFALNEFNCSNTGYSACFAINSSPEIFDITLSFSKGLIKWSEYSGKSWYVKDRS